MGMVPELPIAMLACRLGAPHTVVFGGFSSRLARRAPQRHGVQAADHAGRGLAARNHRAAEANADAALADAATVEKTVVLRRTGGAVAMEDGRDVWWHDAVEGESDDPATCPCEPMESEDLLYLLYEQDDREAEGDRAHDRRLPRRHRDHAPLHLRHQARLDLLVRRRHRLGHRAQLHRLQAALQQDDRRDLRGHARLRTRTRWWDIVERYRVDILYTTPTAIRAHMKWGRSTPRSTTSPSLRPRERRRAHQPEAWVWYHGHIGGGRCPIVDTWWQTETGMILITPLPGVTTLKPGSATKPFPGVEAGVRDEAGNEVGSGGGGYLVLERPWPAMLHGIHKEHDRFVDTYWSRYPDVYFAGDGARVDEDRDFWLLGRVDDVMNVSGHPDLDDRGRARSSTTSPSPRPPCAVARIG